MKITIEPTEHVYDLVSVSVASANDDSDLAGVLELFRAALLAWGFVDEIVAQAIPYKK